MDRLYKHEDPAFTANPVFGVGENKSFSWSATPQSLFFGSSVARSFQTTATIVIEPS
jgi:hypothetical protein